MSNEEILVWLSVIATGSAAIFGLIKLWGSYIWPFMVGLDVAAKIINEELQHNGGSSMKDQLKKATEDLDLLKKSHVQLYEAYKEHVAWSDRRSAEVEEELQRRPVGH